MQIEHPQTKQHEGRHAFMTRISVDNQEIKLPETLWFSLRGDPSFEYPALSDAFLIGMLPIAMKLGESIRVDGPISERLAYGLQTYQSILNCWWPEIFNVIDVNYAELLNRQYDVRLEGVGSCFSGGVDSFYTVLKHLPEEQQLKEYQLTHALMFNRFDKVEDFEEEELPGHLFYENYRSVLEQWGINLLLIDTNLRQYRRYVFKDLEIVTSYNSILCACAHVLGSLFGRFIIPGHGSYAYTSLIPWGSHPVLDHHMSSDQLQIIHHAEDDINRRDKIKYLADNQVIQKNLHVCFKRPVFDKETDTVLNCCECEKCIRTLITLELLGKKKPFQTFPQRFDPGACKQPELLATYTTIFLKGNLKLARSVDNMEWVHILEKALHINEKARLNKKLPRVKNFIQSAFNRVTFRERM